MFPSEPLFLLGRRIKLRRLRGNATRWEYSLWNESVAATVMNPYSNSMRPSLPVRIFLTLELSQSTTGALLHACLPWH
jgi:hypothetical protein